METMITLLLYRRKHKTFTAKAVALFAIPGLTKKGPAMMWLFLNKNNTTKNQHVVFVVFVVSLWETAGVTFLDNPISSTEQGKGGLPNSYLWIVPNCPFTTFKQFFFLLL